MAYNAKLVAIPDDAVRITVGGVDFSDWFDVDIDSDIFTPSDHFKMSGVIPQRVDLFREGQRVDVYLGPDRQMAGVLDEPEMIISRENSRISVSGRDLGSYLEDSEAKAERFSNYTLQTLAEHLLRPEWGIKKVITSNEDNRRVVLGKKERERYKPGKAIPSLTGTPTKRRHTKIDPGQTVRQILDEHCMRHGVSWWMTADGNLFIGKPQYNQQVSFEFFLYSSGNIRRGQNNVLEATVKRGLHERYSKIVVVGESSANNSNKSSIFDDTVDALLGEPSPAEERITAAKRAKKYRGEATDPDLVSRGITRELRLVDNDALSNEMCKAKAEAEMGRRRLTGLQITLVLDDFRQNGRIISVDCLARVVIEEAQIDGVYWISQRRFRESRGERRTSVTLHEKGVWLP